MIKDLLLKGSFKGVEYNFISAATTKGRRVEIDEFINSETIEYEDLGKGRTSFSLNIRLSASGSDYFVNRSRLEEALDSEGEGDLVHPTRGNFVAIVDGNYTIDEGIDELGNIGFKVRFTVIESGVLVLRSTATVERQFAQADETARKKADEFGEKYGLSFLDSLKQAQKYVADLSKKFRTAQDIIEDPRKAGEFAAQLLGFEKGTFNTGYDLARDTYLLYYNANNFIESAFDRFNFFKELFGFGDDEPTIPQTTRARVENASNQVLQKSIVQTMALTFGSFSASEIEYTTDVELTTNSEVIQLQFVKVMNDDGTDSDTYSDLQIQRVEFTQIMKDKTLDVSRIIEIEAKGLGLSTLIYKYYGLSEGSEGFDEVYNLIIGLNGFDETGGITGTIKIITESAA